MLGDKASSLRRAIYKKEMPAGRQKMPPRGLLFRVFRALDFVCRMKTCLFFPKSVDKTAVLRYTIY